MRFNLKKKKKINKMKNTYQAAGKDSQKTNQKTIMYISNFMYFSRRNSFALHSAIRTLVVW